jgi:hypothetical protein
MDVSQPEGTAYMIWDGNQRERERGPSMEAPRQRQWSHRPLVVKGSGGCEMHFSASAGTALPVLFSTYRNGREVVFQILIN